METNNPNNPEQEKNRVPDFVKDPADTEKFGDKPDGEIQQENYPNAGNQTQTGAATNKSDLDIEPEGDEDDSLIGPED